MRSGGGHFKNAFLIMSLLFIYVCCYIKLTTSIIVVQTLIHLNYLCVQAIWGSKESSSEDNEDISSLCEHTGISRFYILLLTFHHSTKGLQH